jgi:hypothetical protein
MAGVLGKIPIDTARTEIIMLLNAPNTKLELGDNKMLAIIIGSVNRNNVRPPETCSAVSLNAKIMVRKVKNKKAAIFPDQ